MKRITRGNYTCKLCGELVQCTLDTVLVCKRCSVFFHLNCATPFAKVGGQVGCDELACPGCGASSEDDDEQQQQQKQKQKQKQQLPNIKEIKEEKGEGDEEEMTPRDLLGRLHDLHQYIHSLNHANQVLGSLCLVSKLRSEKRPLVLISIVLILSLSTFAATRERGEPTSPRSGPVRGRLGDDEQGARREAFLYLPVGG